MKKQSRVLLSLVLPLVACATTPDLTTLGEIGDELVGSAKEMVADCLEFSRDEAELKDCLDAVGATAEDGFDAVEEAHAQVCAEIEAKGGTCKGNREPGGDD